MTKTNNPGFDKTAYGIGGSYDLGSGASLLGTIQKKQEGGTYADAGVKFAF